MAGSYQHTVADDGQLLVNERLQGMLECSSGDVYEAIEEYYGMVWFLAHQLSQEIGVMPREIVHEAQSRYRDGLHLSPGTEGTTDDDEDDDG